MNESQDSQQTSAAITVSSPIEELRTSLAETRALYEITRAMIANHDLDELLQTVVNAVAVTLPADRVILITFDLQAQQIVKFVRGGVGARHVVTSITFEELWRGLSGWVLRELQPALSPKTSPDPRELPDVQKRRAETHCGDIIVVPLVYQDRTLGTMTAINSPDCLEFGQKHVDLMLAMAGHAAIGINTAELYTRLHSVNKSLQLEIAERRESHLRIRELAHRLETVREDERRTISQLLHEGIAQELFAMKLALDGLQPQAEGRTGVTEAFEELAEALHKCMDNIRRVANELRPAALVHMPVSVAIEQHARSVAELSSLSIRVTEAISFPRLDEAMRLILFRAAQEALANVARHARASRVDVILRADSESIMMDVIDDGIGIDENALSKPGSLGLLGMRERLDARGDTLCVRKNAGAGTTLSIRLNLPKISDSGADQSRI
jgi:signal transduction histidine kinase